MMKISDFVADFIVKQGVKDVFLISGGGMMHLLDSVGNDSRIRKYYNLNEQATSVCATAYARYNNYLGVGLVTTGPGGTNAVTGVASAYTESLPLLMISGQVKTSDSAKIRHVRQFGGQEIDITDIVRPITKYSVCVTNAADIKYELEKAVYLATHGRRGPVWIDIPLDIQGTMVETEELRGFVPQDTDITPLPDSDAVQKTLAMMAEAKRPLILIGYGAECCADKSKLKEFIEMSGVPVVTTWRALDVLPYEHPLNFHHAGSPGARYSNFILQTCDFLLVLGCRLNPALTTYNEPDFAPKAKHVIVDIDENEVAKLEVKFEQKHICDVGDFIEACLMHKQPVRGDISPWMSYCNRVKREFPIEKEKQPYELSGINGYDVGFTINKLSADTDVLVGSPAGRACGISHLCFYPRAEQKMINEMGMGSMGFVVPYCIAAAVASKGRRVLALEGDGSLQHNIQELELIRRYNLPIKLFVLNNGGYASISNMQRNHFSTRLAGADPGSGLSFPKTSDVAKAYGIDYCCVRNTDELEKTVAQMLSDDKAGICEIMIDERFDEIPKAATQVHADGSITSSQLDNLFPFLPEEVRQKWLVAAEAE